MIVLLNVQETCRILKEHGMPMNPVHLRAGIDCKAYPFGVSIPMGKRNSYEIYKPLLMRWIAEREEERSEEETTA